MTRKTKTCYVCHGSGSIEVSKAVWVKGEYKVITDYEDCHRCEGKGEIAA